MRTPSESPPPATPSQAESPPRTTRTQAETPGATPSSPERPNAAAHIYIYSFANRNTCSLCVYIYGLHSIQNTLEKEQQRTLS